MSSGVYTVINLINRKQYVGSAINLNKRKYEHFNTPKLSNPHLQRAMRKYGQENFKFKVLEYVDNTKDLIQQEQIHIDAAKKNNVILYNIALKAGSALGVKRSNKTKLKMSKAKMGHSVSEETREKARQQALGNKNNLGKKRTPEQIENIRKGHEGQVVPEYVRQKSLEARKGKPFWNRGLTKETNFRIKKMSESLKGKIPWNIGLSENKVNHIELINFYLQDNTIIDCMKKFYLSDYTIRQILLKNGAMRTRSQASKLNHKRRI